MISDRHDWQANTDSREIASESVTVTTGRRALTLRLTQQPPSPGRKRAVGEFCTSAGKEPEPDRDASQALLGDDVLLLQTLAPVSSALAFILFPKSSDGLHTITSTLYHTTKRETFTIICRRQATGWLRIDASMR